MSAPTNFIQESKYIPDFYKGRTGFGWDSGAIAISSSNTVGTAWTLVNAAGEVQNVETTGPKKAADLKAKKKAEKPKRTPKNVYDMKMLNDKKFTLNVDPKYVAEQVQAFKDKLAMISSEEYDMRRGVEECASILLRMQNRLKFAEHRKFFDQFAYTSTKHMEGVVKAHDYLQVGQIAQFMADLPKEAVDVMKQYDAECMKLCGKKAVFYIIADKKDFQKTNSRRDPILLAQSPFGHVWQILGAWDKEMLFLDEM